MDVSFSHFLQEMSSNPVLLITVILTLGVIFVNGWTDAPNAIATCITTRCYGGPHCDLAQRGLQLFGRVHHDPNQQLRGIYHQQHGGFRFGNTQQALIALCAALFSIVVYSVGASYFGIPTSESHSLIAGLSGAAIAIQNGVGGINMEEWVKVLYGLVLSLLLGFPQRLSVLQAADRPLL